MTAYVTLKAVKEGRITLDTLLTVSPVAASQAPAKIGFRPGTQVTVDNALKIMLVRSANDMAVVLAEGVGGSIDGFSALMNQAAQQLGMTQTSYVNPNGLPADGQITSARDLAILARAIIHDLPEYEYFVHIPSIRYGRRVTQNFNKLIGRYPGADGFKTGFICASGYNLVASATRDGRRLIAVVLGASSGKMRAVRAAQLLERGFANNSLSWLRPSLGTVDNLVPIDASPPNLRDEMCGGKHHKPASDEDEDNVANSAGSGNGEPAPGIFRRRAATADAEAVGIAGGSARALGADSGLHRTDQDRRRIDRRGCRRMPPSRRPVITARKFGSHRKSRMLRPIARTTPRTPPRIPPRTPSRNPRANRPPPGMRTPSRMLRPKAADKPDAKPAKPKAAAKPKPAPKNTTGEAQPADQKTAAPRS